MKIILYIHSLMPYPPPNGNRKIQRNPENKVIIWQLCTKRNNLDDGDNFCSSFNSNHYAGFNKDIYA